MKPKDFCFELWDPSLSLVVEMEPDEPGNKIFRADGSGRGSSSIFAAIRVGHRHILDADETARAKYLMEDPRNLDVYLTPQPDSPNMTAVQEGVKIIFKNETLVTHNGYPRAQLEGPAMLIERSPTPTE